MIPKHDVEYPRGQHISGMEPGSLAVRVKRLLF